MSGGGGGDSKQTVQNYSPEEAARRTALMDEAKKIYDAQQGTLGTYPGATPTPASPATLQAEQYLQASVPGQTATANALQGATQFGLSDVLYANSNPYLQSSIDAAIRPITEKYTDPNGVMSQIRSGASEAGQYGSSRQGIAEGVAAGRYFGEVGDVSSKMASEGYQQGLDTFSKTMALTPTSMQASNIPAQTLANVGASQEGRTAEQLAYEEQQRLWGINAPWMPLQNYANMVYGAGSSGATSKTTGGGSGGASGALQGAAMGQGLAQLIAGGSGLALGPVGIGMTVLGALAGF